MSLARNITFADVSLLIMERATCNRVLLATVATLTDLLPPTFLPVEAALILVTGIGPGLLCSKFAHYAQYYAHES